MLIQDFNFITFINFGNSINLDFTENNFLNINFTYKNKKYIFKVYKKINFSYINKSGFIQLEQKILIEDIGTMFVEAKKNKVLKHKDFYFCFIQENQLEGTINFDENSIFTTYKLGILENVE